MADLAGKIYHLLGEMMGDVAFALPVLGVLHLFVYAVARRRPWLALLAAILLPLVVLVFHPLAVALPGLTRESLQEATSFDLQEASFFLSNLHGEVFQGLRWKRVVAWGLIYLAYGAAFALLARFVRRRWRIGEGMLTGIAVAVLTVPFLLFSGIVATQGLAEAEAELATMRRNFAPDSGLLQVRADPDNSLNVVLYIGESTSSANWSLYDYPRPTTPGLDALERDGRLVVFGGVTAPFPQTTRSLLEVLSVPAATSASRNPLVTEQRRQSVVDVLGQTGIATLFFSNQSRFGTWNAASDVIFARAAEKRFSTERKFGNFDYFDDRRPYDHQFLAPFLEAVGDPEASDARLFVFHSYAGHGDYQQFLPRRYRRPVDRLFSGLREEAVVGRGADAAALSMVEAYDEAMRYVADNVARAIEAVDASDEPTVFIYFSDHGESPSSGRMHDASRYVREMGTVPLVMHFNRAALSRHADLAAKYRGLAAADRDASLVNLPSLLFDLLGVDVSYRGGGTHPVSRCTFAGGDCEPLRTVLQRRLDGTLTYVETLRGQGVQWPGAVDVTDRNTAHHNLLRKLAGRPDAPSLCTHRNTTLARQLRSRTFADCIELDLVVSKEGRIEVFHPPAENLGLPLARALAAMGNRPTTFWLDAKNIDDPRSCAALVRFVAQNADAHRTFFVEFPGSAKLDAIAQCARSLEASGAARSFYVPTELAVTCASDAASRSCVSLESTLAAVARSGLFSDISFDFAAYRAISRSPAAQAMRWNTWFIPDDEILRLPPGRFRLVIPFADELNLN